MPGPVRLDEFDAALRPRLKAYQLMHVASAAGVFVFAAVVGLPSLLSAGQARQAGPEDIRLALILSAFHAAFLVGVLAFGSSVSKLLLRPRAHGPDEPSDGAELWVARIGGSMMVRLALLEGAAMFGLVTLFIGVLNGAALQQPRLGLNAVSAGVMIAYAAQNFPTAERFRSIFRERMV